jgi:hypothetical protein
MKNPDDVNGLDEAIARRKRLDGLAIIRDMHEENRTREDRKISEIKWAILTEKVQIPPELTNASVEELIDYVKKSTSNPLDTDENPSNP